MAVTAGGKNKIDTGLRLYVGGFDLSGDMRTFSAADMTYDTVDMTAWSDDVKSAYATWGTTGITGYQALMNDAAFGASTILALTATGAQTGTQLSLCFGSGGAEAAVPDPAYLLSGLELSDVMTVNGVGTLQGDFVPDAGQAASAAMHPHGVVLRGNTLLTATLTGSSSNSVDNEGATTNGWHAHIHVLLTNSANFAFKIRHSTDDSSWADLGTFTTTGGTVAAEVLTGTGTVNQYVAFDATRTAGSATVIVTFARN